MRIVWDLRKQDGNPHRFFKVTKGNYLSESTKSKSLELRFNEKQEFEFTGQYGNTTNFNSKQRFTDGEKLAIMTEIENMLEAKLPYSKMLIELSKIGFETIPSIGTLSNWINEKKRVH
jgi:hypothetical protein